MASLLFGISFRNPDTGEQAQLGLEAGTNQLYVRSTTGGDWSAWEKVGGNDEEQESVILAKSALKWAAPLTLKLTGAVAGEVEVDGSEGVVSCSLSHSGETMNEAMVEKIARRIAGELVRAHEERYDHYDSGSGN